jgi:uncharacterized protein YndB with AHSA1/START domain
MKNPFIAKASIEIHAPAESVWHALITPELIKQYLFGTEAISDWQEGSTITYRGIWEGRAYEDKGTILKLLPNEVMVTTHWSSMSGLEDVPENYSTVNYTLTPNGEKTTLEITQDNIATEESRQHSEKNWSMVLEGIKKVVEQK